MTQPLSPHRYRASSLLNDGVDYRCGGSLFSGGQDDREAGKTTARRARRPRGMVTEGGVGGDK